MRNKTARDHTILCIISNIFHPVPGGRFTESPLRQTESNSVLHQKFERYATLTCSKQATQSRVEKFFIGLRLP